MSYFTILGIQIPFSQVIFGVNEGKNRIAIPPQEAPRNQTYYIRLSSANGTVSLLGRDEDNYPYGTATTNDRFIDADLAFRARYEYSINSVLADLDELASKFKLALPLVILLFLPGWILLDLTELKNQFDWGERIAISLGISLAVIPLLMLWTSLVGLKWGPISIWLVSGLLVVTVVWRWYRESPLKRYWKQVFRKKGNGTSEGTKFVIEESQTCDPTQKNNFENPILIRLTTSIILILIFAITLFTRFAMVRDLAAPPWVDSIHHGLITRLMMESGGLPETYVPYLPSEADFYHFGFHSTFTTFIWLTGFDIHEGLLIFGQVLNALIVFSIYLLVKTLTNNRAAALTGALIVGVFTLMPAYYTSWGRYTQLTGLLVLPTSFAIFLIFSKNEYFSTKKKISLWALGTITFAGLLLIHYRVAAFLGFLIFAYLIAQINFKDWLKNIGHLAILSIFCVILLLPWLPGMITNLLVPKGNAWSGNGGASFSQIPWNFLKPGLGETALVLAGIGMVFGIILFKRFTLTIILWIGMMYLLANLNVFGLPGSGFVNPVSVEITLFIPVSVLGGFAVGGTLELLDKIIPDRWQTVPRLLFIIVGSGAAILGAQRLLPTLNPITFLAREADFTAINWIDLNIPDNEIILINPTGWGYGLYMGHDGGYWISPLTGRQTLPPPVLYGLGDRDEIDRFNHFIEGVLPIGEETTALWELLRSENIRFVYTGGRGGIISPRALAESGLFVTRYQHNGTWVFETLDHSP